MDEGALSKRANKALGELLDGFDRWSGWLAAQGANHVEIAEMILDESGYTEMWLNDKSPEAAGRLENLK